METKDRITIEDYWTSFSTTIFELPLDDSMKAILKDCFLAGATAQNAVIKKQLEKNFSSITQLCNSHDKTTSNL